MTPIALFGVFYLPLADFRWFMGAIVVIGAWEFANLSGMKAQWQRILYAIAVGVTLWVSSFVAPVWILSAGVVWWLLALAWVLSYPSSSNQWHFIRWFIGFAVLVPAWVGLVVLKGLPHGNYLILYVLVLVWGADVGAFFAGRTWGKRKLAPSVSPGKSWEGVWGGLACTSIVAFFVSLYLELALKDASIWLLMSVVTVFASVLGDLAESMLKRHAGVKDSSQLLPGHGGFLDRIDSVTAAMPVFTLVWLTLDWGFLA